MIGPLVLGIVLGAAGVLGWILWETREGDSGWPM